MPSEQSVESTINAITDLLFNTAEKYGYQVINPESDDAYDKIIESGADVTDGPDLEELIDSNPDWFIAKKGKPLFSSEQGLNYITAQLAEDNGGDKLLVRFQLSWPYGTQNAQSLERLFKVLNSFTAQ